MNKAGVNTYNESLWFKTGPGTDFDAHDDRTWGFKMWEFFFPAESLIDFSSSTHLLVVSYLMRLRYLGRKEICI